MAAAKSVLPGEEISRKTITSRCIPQVDRCLHVFEIHGYTLQEDMGDAGKPVLRSAPFAVGGHQWRISFYPDGYYGIQSSGCASIFVNFMSDGCPEGTKVRAHARFRHFNPAAGEFSIMPADFHIKFTVEPGHCNASWGTCRFVSRRWLQTSGYLGRDDRLIIECDLSVVVGNRVSEPETTTTTPCEEHENIEVPPSILSENFGRLLDSKEAADVTFKVKGVVLHAHKVVLAARSPVFKAELYGHIGGGKKKNQHIRNPSVTIQDMEPGVFKALLHFIYTDSLPAAHSGDDCDLDLEDEGVVKHLLVAADRYGMDRMRLMCESMLCRRLDVENVADTLALAEQHYCCKLKDTCISFIISSRERIKDVMATKGYEHLKKACPSIVMYLLEESVKSSVC